MNITLRDYNSVEKRFDAGHVVVSLIGKDIQYERNGDVFAERGNPYYLVVRVLFDSEEIAPEAVTLNDIAVKSQVSGLVVLKKDNITSEVKGPDYQGLRYASYLFEDLDISYENYIVFLNFSTNTGSSDKTFISVVLEKKYSKKSVNKWIEGLKGV